MISARRTGPGPFQNRSYNTKHRQTSRKFPLPASKKILGKAAHCTTLSGAMIHATAVIHSKAEIDPAASVGPCAVIDEGVRVGGNCKIGPHVHITGRTLIGAGNVFHAGCVIGDAPQDLKYGGEPTGLVIGDNNVFREHVTVHRSNKVGEETVIGSNNYLMANSHLGHNSRLGNHVIIANGALLGGHVQVDDRAFISGNCLVHQFTRIGTLALMQGGAGISKDLPPFTIARGVNTICGLNSVGLRRAGLSSRERIELKRLYHALFRGGGRFQEALAAAEKEFTSPAARVLLEFVAASKRGVCPDAGSGGNSEAVE
jgi:UDP-N-acetylglucosamine acyltransferase